MQILSASHQEIEMEEAKSKRQRPSTPAAAYPPAEEPNISSSVAASNLSALPTKFKSWRPSAKSQCTIFLFKLIKLLQNIRSQKKSVSQTFMEYEKVLQTSAQWAEQEFYKSLNPIDGTSKC